MQTVIMLPVRLIYNKTFLYFLEDSCSACYREVVVRHAVGHLPAGRMPEDDFSWGGWGRADRAHLKAAGRGNLNMPGIGSNGRYRGKRLVFMSAWFPGPHDIRRSPDTGSASRGSADRDGLPGILTSLITSAMDKGKPEVKRLGNVGPASAGERTRRVRRNRLRRIIQDQTAGSRRDLGTPGRQDAASVVFWQALDPVANGTRSDRSRTRGRSPPLLCSYRRVGY